VRFLPAAVLGLVVCFVGSTALVAVAATPDLRARQLRASEVPGSRIIGVASLVPDARLWVSTHPIPVGGVDAAVARLQRHGFVAGSDEVIVVTDGQGVSVIEEFASHHGAIAEVTAPRPTSTASTVPLHVFAVPGIPGAHGYSYKIGDVTEVGIAFLDGSYLYSIVFAVSPYSTKFRAGLIADASTLYERVHAYP
jgi:hypothetical protein